MDVDVCGNMDIVSQRDISDKKAEIINAHMISNAHLRRAIKTRLVADLHIFAHAGKTQCQHFFPREITIHFYFTP